MATNETINTNFNFQGFSTLKKDLREATALYQQMLQSGKATTAEMEAQAKKVADLKDAIDDANEATAALTGAGRIQAFGRAITAISGGFTAVQGAIALTGVESEDLQKTMVKLQAAMALTQGLAALEDLPNAMKNAARATGLATVAMRAYTFVTNGATLATKAFRAALVSLGAGAVLVGLGLIVNKLLEMGEAAKGAKTEVEKIEELGDILEQIGGQASEIQSKVTANLLRSIENVRKTVEAGEKGIMVEIDGVNKFIEFTKQGFKELTELYVRAQNQISEETKTKIEEEIEAQQAKNERIIQDGVKALKELTEKETKEVTKRNNTIASLEKQKNQAIFESDRKLLNEQLEGRIKKEKASLEAYKQEIAQDKQVHEEKMNLAYATLVNLELELQEEENLREDAVDKIKEILGGLEKYLEDKRVKSREKAQADRDKETEETRKRFEDEVKNSQQSLEKQFAQEKEFNEKVNRLEQAQTEDEMQRELFAFDNAKRLREKDYEDQLKILEARKKINEQYVKDLTEEDKEKYAELIKDIKKDTVQVDKEIVELTRLLGLERLANEKELAELIKRLSKQTADQQIADQEAVLKANEDAVRGMEDNIQRMFTLRQNAVRRSDKSRLQKSKEIEELEKQKFERLRNLYAAYGMSAVEIELEISNFIEQQASDRARYISDSFNAGLDAGRAYFQGVSELDAIRTQNAIDNINLTEEERERIAKESFEKQKALQRTLAVIDAAKAVSSIYAQWPKFDGGFMMYAALIQAGITLGIQLAKIDAAQYNSPVSSAGRGEKPAGSKFQEGGLLIGPSHGMGGIKTAMGELEGGEFVVNRIAAQEFMPILDKINSFGQNPSERMSRSQPTPIVKTYVVATDMASELQKQKRMRDMARL